MSVNGAARIQWSNELKSLFTTTSHNGIVSVYSQHDTMNPNLMKNRKGDANIAPSWLQKKSGAAFGFGGKILTFSTNNDASSMELHSFRDDSQLSEKALEFENLLNQESLAPLCLQKVYYLIVMKNRQKNVKKSLRSH